MSTPETICPASREEWRQWLQEHHETSQSVWFVYYKKAAGKPSIPWSDAVDEALCFGWVDSIRKPLDAERFIQFFGKRKPKSTWSKINKEKVKRLIAEGKMMPAGYASIEVAKKNGSWTILDEVEELIIPDDLEAAFAERPGSKDHFMSLSKSARKVLLSGLVFAKRPETRQKRIDEIVSLKTDEVGSK